MIQVEHLTKEYGDFLAVDDLSFTIEDGHVYGFLGPNGAGKSTTMNIIAGCLSASEGTVKIDGYDIFDEPDQAKKRIGYLPEHPPLYMNETPFDYLYFVAEAKGLKGAELLHQIYDAAEKTKIEDVMHKRISALSKGYKQRVGIAQALLSNPSTIILDEPTVGLDPIQILEIRSLIKELGKTHTIIFSSHILSEVQAICDQILMISKGKLVAFDTPEHLEKRFLASNEIGLLVDAEEKEIQKLLLKMPEIREIEMDAEDSYLRVILHVESDDMIEISRKIFRGCAQHGFDLLELSLKKGSLEDVFIELSELDENQNQVEKESDEA